MFLKIVQKNIIFVFYMISNIGVSFIDGAVKQKKTFIRKPSRYQQNSFLNSGSDFG
jgi:hypothetical protein